MARLMIAVLSCAILIAVVFLTHRSGQNFDQVIQIGEQREGLLHQNDPIRSEVPRGPEARWRFRGQTGKAITLAAESYEFDVYLLLIDQQGRLIASSDNSGGFSNARIRTTLQAQGWYTAIVCGANADQFGTYWLSFLEGDHDIDRSQAAVESYYRRGVEWGERVMNRRALSWLALGMAQYFRHQRQWQKSDKYCALSLAQAEKSDFTYGKCAVLLERGRLFARLRRYDQAVSEFQHAVQLNKNLRSGQEVEALLLIELGKLYFSSARGELAKVYFENAIKQTQPYALPSTLVELYTSLSSFLNVQDKDRAIEYAQKSYDLCNGLDPALELSALHTLAGTRLFLEPDRLPEGMMLAADMRKRAQQLGYLDEEVAAITLMSISKYATGNIEEMISLAGEALKLTDPSDEDPSPRRVALQMQADGQMLRENYQAALELCLEALNIVERAWTNEYIEELRRELLSQSRAICTQIIKNLYALNARAPNPQYAREAFNYAERSRSRSLLEHLLPSGKENVSGINQQAISRNREIFDELSSVRGQIAKLRTSDYASRGTLRHLQEQRADLITEQMQFQGEIHRATKDNYNADNLSLLTAEQVQRKIAQYHPNSVILYYQPGIQESFLIVLTRNETHLFKLPDLKTISTAVTEWRARIASQLNSSEPSTTELYNYNQAANRLYNILVEPAAHLIKNRDLIIVPSDAFSQVAFEALVVNSPAESTELKQSEYLLEGHAVSYAASASVLFEIESRRRHTAPKNQMLLLGDTFPAGEDSENAQSGTSRATAFDRLPATRLEVLDIARIAEQHNIAPTILLGAEANESRFKSIDLSRFRFIHIATHGLSDYQDGEASALTLATDSKAAEDGFLTSNEIEKLRLRADLVVLSGCETSNGQKDGAEGIVGLNRAFLIAGTQSVCGSLWPVEDSWTQKFMSSFYRNLIADRHNKSQALRLAKLNLLKRGASPFQWAAFVLAGSPR